MSKPLRKCSVSPEMIAFHFMLLHKSDEELDF